MEINNFIIQKKTNRTSIKELSHLFYHEKIIYNSKHCSLISLLHYIINIHISQK